MLICHHKGAEGKYSTAGTHTTMQQCEKIRFRQVPEGLPGYLYHLYSYLYNATSNVKTSIPDGSQEVSWGREANDEGSSVETVLSQSPLVSILY